MNALLRSLSSLWLTSSSNSHMTRRFMSKYLSKSATKRLPLTSKRARKGYYKGNGATKEGRLTSKGKFIVDPSKQLELVVPDLTGFKVRLHCLLLYNGQTQCTGSHVVDSLAPSLETLFSFHS